MRSAALLRTVYDTKTLYATQTANNNKKVARRLLRILAAHTKHTNIQTYKHTNIQTYKHTNIHSITMLSNNVFFMNTFIRHKRQTQNNNLKNI